jgi:hypothetical protein
VQNVRVLTSGKQREDACELPKYFAQIAGNVSVASRTLRSAQCKDAPVSKSYLDLIGFIAGSDCDTRLRRGDVRSPLAVSSRDG